MEEMFRIRLTIKLAPRKQESHNFTDRYEYASCYVVEVLRSSSFMFAKCFSIPYFIFEAISDFFLVLGFIVDLLYYKKDAFISHYFCMKDKF